MTTSLVPELLLDGAVRRRDLAFFRYHLHNCIHEFVSARFRHLRDTEGVTYASLAKRIGRSRKAVIRCVANPANMPLDTLSDLMVGMGVDPTTLLVDDTPESAPTGEQP